MHGHILYALAVALGVFALFVLWVWTGPIGVLLAAGLTHGLLRLSETRRDREVALARKARAATMRDIFDSRPPD